MPQHLMGFDRLCRCDCGHSVDNSGLLGFTWPLSNQSIDSSHILPWHVPNAACEMALICSSFADAWFIVHNLDEKTLNIV